MLGRITPGIVSWSRFRILVNMLISELLASNSSCKRQRMWIVKMKIRMQSVDFGVWRRRGPWRSLLTMLDADAGGQVLHTHDVGALRMVGIRLVAGWRRTVLMDLGAEHVQRTQSVKCRRCHFHMQMRKRRTEDFWKA
jgi:hypothetical protein